ncbi:hypothetical protein IEN85_16865 [Pelagicoccus sp. NFK12]|uniref:Fibronectin type III domain-containing protein n=1 Tax=Pelagicoccus enzymogenes TaxID=2773457 RepID=A0A927FB50_9BACT|nr:immunoglobulin domain-containing protein [Pelagicoccus enzymogenes]MBD5781174.1 hypothetical protein [Pelagicoccus enzymogenes]
MAHKLLAILLTATLSASSNLLLAGSNPPHPEGLLLRGFESEAALNRRGDQAVLNGVQTTVRIDAAGEVSSSASAADLAPLVGWYRDRGQYYSAYADFGPGIGSAIGFTDAISSAGKTLTLDGDASNPSIFLDETYQAILTVAKAYVDAGVDAIHYDTAWVTLDAGPFDAATLVAFRDWLNARYDETTLQSYVDSSYDDATFDYGAFLRSEGVTASNYATATIDGVKLGSTKHWRLWQAFLRYKEREVIATLVDEVNTYAQSEIGREIGFYFNRYGFINRPADRWFLAEYASGDLGETHFGGQSWEYADGYNLEPVFRANLKTYDNRFEPWNAPPATNTAVQSLFLAESIANNGVATWEDAYPATAPIARLAKQYEDQLDHTPLSQAAIFYPLATALHTETLQVGPDPGLLGGDHYWYLGLGYIMQELEINYDVAFGGDGLGMPDTFATEDISDYAVVFASEAIQVTDSQFTELMDYVNNGGTLIVSGSNVFRYDALGNDKSSTRSYDSKTWSQLFGSVGNTSIGSGTLKVVSLDPWGSTGYTDQPSSSNLTTALAGFEAALPSTLERVTNAATGDVRVLSYVDSSDYSRVYQLLNYSFNGSGTSITSQSNFTLTFPTPAEFPSPTEYQSESVATYVASADSTPTTLAITDLENGFSQVTIPSLNYWGILRIGSAITERDHPNIAPIAYFDSLFSYEVFNSTETRSLTYSAFDDDEITQLQVYYSKKDTGTGEFGAWTADQIIAGNGSNEIVDASVDYTLPSEGHFRLQIVATDSDSASNALLGDDAFDTEVGYDTTAMDRSSLVVTPLHGTASGAVITSPLTPSFTFTGHSDPISGYGQYNWSWNNGGNTIDGGGNPLTESITLDSIPAIVEGEYGEYGLSLRFQNGAQIWDDSETEYTLIYTIAPTYDGAEVNESTTSGSNVDFTLDYTSVYGDVSIQWYKDDVAIDGQTEGTLSLFSVTSDDNGTYHATIANPAGEITSPDFNLTVSTPLEVTQQPAGAILNEGESFSVTVEARGTGTLNYQWTLEGVDIPGATSSTYSVNSAVRATHHGHYRARITDDLTSITSNGAFVQISNQPGGGGGGGGSTPTAPSNLNGSDNGTDSVTLTWQDNSNNETGFALERRQQGTDNWISVSGAIPTNNTQFVDATDIGNDTYEYRIKATGSSGDSSYSNVAAVSRSSGPGPLAAPTSLSASDNTAHVRLEWTDNATSETGYTIEWKLQSSSTWQVFANIGANSNAFTHPVNIGSDTYEYRVKATNNGESSDYSNVASVSREGGGGGGEITPPAAPANLAAEDKTSKVTLTWDDLSNDETGFSIQRRKQGDQTWSQLATTAANVTTYNDNLDIGTDSFEYRVAADKGEVASGYSNVATVKREGGGEITPPAAPANLAAEDKTSKVTLTWDDLSNDETGFSIQRRKQGDQTWSQLATTAANSTTYDDNLDIGTDTFEYRVAADKGEVASDYSNVAMVSRPVSGSDIHLIAIVNGPVKLELDLKTTDTVETLRNEIASALQASGDELQIFLGASELATPSQSLEDAGFADGDQFTVTRTEDSANSNYTSWQLAHLGNTRENRLPHEDANHDGIANLLHYAFGSSPTEIDLVANHVNIELTATGFSVSYHRNKNASGITLEIESFNFETEAWETLSSLSETTQDTAEAHIEKVTVQYPVATDGQLMLRLKTGS